MKQKYVLLWLLLFFAAAEPCWAQNKNIEITVVSVDATSTSYIKEEKPLSRAEVYGFYDFPKAEAFRRRLVDDLSYIPDWRRDCDQYTQTDEEGLAEIELPLNGVVVVRPPFGNPYLEHVRNRLSLKVTIKNDEGRMMKQLVTSATQKRRNKPRPNRRVGNKITIGPRAFLLYDTETRSNARAGLSPIVTVLESYDSIHGTIDTFEVMRPFVKDGVAYHRSQDRRMGYEMKNDSLYRFASKNFMKTREEDSIVIFHVLYPVERNKHYKVDATKWFEDYNMVYTSDSVCLSEGYDEEPMRFLEFDMMDVDIDRIRYERHGKRETLNDTRDLHLNFVVGEARLDPNDSTNFEQLNQLKTDLARYVNDKDASITSAVIRGKASPEGGMATNARLCAQRAAYLRSEITSSFPSLSGIMKSSGDVATWSDVADLLEQDSLQAEAQQVREIVDAVRDTRAQELRIRKLACYEYIKEKVLPRLRVVEFSFDYVAKRIRTPEEINALYDTDPGYRDGSKEKDYEFYILFDRVKDKPQELKTLAQAAYKSVKDLGNDRQWPLAAYYLAKCRLKENQVDTALLKPYLNWFAGPNYEKRDVNQQSQGWYNDEAIVCTQIAMLCKAGDYVMADSVAANLLPDTPKFARLRLFLDCLNEGWNEPRVRDSIAETSPMNKAVVYAAQDDPDVDNTGFHKAALYLLQDSTQLNPKDPRVRYLEAILRFRLEANRDATKYYDRNFIFDEFYEEADGIPRSDWGFPMVECMKLDEKYMNILKYDGYFNKAYREAFQAYWKKLKEAPKQEDTVNEYEY